MRVVLEFFDKLLEFLLSIFRQLVIVFVVVLVCCTVFLSVVLMRVEPVALTGVSGKNLIAFIAEAQKPGGCIWAGFLIDAEKERECAYKRDEEHLAYLAREVQKITKTFDAATPNSNEIKADFFKSSIKSSHHDRPNDVFEIFAMFALVLLVLCLIFLTFRKFFISASFFKKKVN